MAIKMRVLCYPENNKKLHTISEVIKAEYDLSVNSVDRIPPAYSCDRERLVILAIQIKGTLPDNYRLFVRELTKSRAANVAIISAGDEASVEQTKELLREAGFAPRMHEIGTLQRNKIKLIKDTAYMIHSVDSFQLAKDISRHAEACGRVIPVLIEVNAAREEQKSGVMPADAEAFLLRTLEFPRLKPRGLMTMGPVSDSPEQLRPYFRATKNLFDKLNTRYGFGESPILSMGMSESYAVAIEEGSTLIRVGRKLFDKNEGRYICGRE